MAENEEIIEEAEDDDAEKAAALLSPEAIVMFPMAIFLDLVGLILTIISILTLFGVLALEIPEIINWISDGAGLIFFGLWVTLRSPFNPETTDAGELAEEAFARRKEMTKTIEKKQPEIERLGKEMKESMKQAKTAAGRMGRGLRFGIVLLGEVAPIIGALPFWTWFVYSELKR